MVAEPLPAPAATHHQRTRTVNAQLGAGYELFDAPFFSRDRMYQARRLIFHSHQKSPALGITGTTAAVKTRISNTRNAIQTLPCYNFVE
jgi:hypothetical protein